MKGLQSRRLATEVLLKVELEGTYVNLALQAALNKSKLSDRDRAFVTFIVNGVVRHQQELDELIVSCSKRLLTKLSPGVKIILRLSIFQLQFAEDIPASAVLNTACEIAKHIGHAGTASYVSGVLRAFLKQTNSTKENPVDLQRSLGKKSDNEAKNSKDLQTNYAQQYSIAPWIIERWLARYKKTECEKLFKFSQTTPSLALRVCQTSTKNTIKGTKILQEIFSSKKLSYVSSKFSEDGLILTDRKQFTGSIEKIPGFAEGLFTIQDPAASLVSLMLSPDPSWVVVDLCAAPGGKTMHLADLMQNKGRIIAVDISAKRLSLLKKERLRLGFQNIETIEADSCNYKPDFAVDAVLIDAPCTGTGVLNRKVDIRHNRKPADLTQLVELQRQLLDNASKIVKPGGILVYATCSIEPEENEENMAFFLKNHPDFQSESLMPFLPAIFLQNLQNTSHKEEALASIEAGYLQLLPSRHQCSGFFICRLKKIAFSH